MTVKKLTPILLADDIEACVAFWKPFGLKTTVSVPHEDRLGFVILQDGDVELMYQSPASAGADAPAAIDGVNRSLVYLEVDKLDDILPKAKKLETVVPERTTFYGAREIFVRDPAGNVVGFAEHSQQPA